MRPMVEYRGDRTPDLKIANLALCRVVRKAGSPSGCSRLASAILLPKIEKLLILGNKVRRVMLCLRIPNLVLLDKMLAHGKMSNRLLNVIGKVSIW